MKTMTVSQVLNNAADYIQTFGWSQGTGWYPECGEPACLEGSIDVAASAQGRTVASFQLATAATDAVSNYLTDRYPDAVNQSAGVVFPFAWNDRFGRTATEVVEVLRAVALIEAAHEDAELLSEVSP